MAESIALPVHIMPGGLNIRLQSPILRPTAVFQGTNYSNAPAALAHSQSEPRRVQSAKKFFSLSTGRSAFVTPDPHSKITAQSSLIRTPANRDDRKHTLAEVKFKASPQTTSSNVYVGIKRKLHYDDYGFDSNSGDSADLPPEFASPSTSTAVGGHFYAAGHLDDFKVPSSQSVAARKRSSSTASLDRTSPCFSSPSIGGHRSSVCSSPSTVDYNRANFSSISRYDNSLSILTQKFMDLLQNAPNNTVNLNDVATNLAVQKRRIYDITNVLEGVELVEKVGKNSIRLKLPELSSADTHSGIDLRPLDCFGNDPEISVLIEQERLADQALADLRESMTSIGGDVNQVRQAFVTYEDLKCAFADSLVMAIKAPTNTKLDVPDPRSTGGNYLIHIKSTGAPIDAFLCSNPDTMQSATECPVVTPNNKTGDTQPCLPASMLNGFSEDPSLVLSAQVKTEADCCDLSLQPSLSLLCSSSASAAFNPLIALEPPICDPLLDQCADYLFALGPDEGLSDLYGDYIASSSSAFCGGGDAFVDSFHAGLVGQFVGQ